MNGNSRKIRIAILVALVAFVGLGVGAGLSGCGTGRGGPLGPDVRAYADDRLNRLRSELKITDEQEPVWKEFRQTVTAQAGKAADGVRTWRNTPVPGTAIERLERGKQALTDGQGALDEIIGATRRLYNVLDKTQQARFDEVARRYGPGYAGRHHRFMHGA